MKDEELLEKMKEEGFFHHNQYEVSEIREDCVILKANLKEESMNPYGTPHGGFIFGLGDTAMGMMVKACGRKGLTLNSNINFLRVAKGDRITAVGRVVKQGAKICYTRADIFDKEENLIAVMDANYCFIED